MPTSPPAKPTDEVEIQEVEEIDDDDANDDEEEFEEEEEEEEEEDDDDDEQQQQHDDPNTPKLLISTPNSSPDDKKKKLLRLKEEEEKRQQRLMAAQKTVLKNPVDVFKNEDSSIFLAKEERFGIGVRLAQSKNGRVYVAEMVDHGPAEQAGMKVGDIIVQVNGLSVEGVKMKAIHLLVSGKAGTAVIIKVKSGKLLPTTKVLTVLREAKTGKREEAIVAQEVQNVMVEIENDQATASPEKEELSPAASLRHKDSYSPMGTPKSPSSSPSTSVLMDRKGSMVINKRKSSMLVFGMDSPTTVARKSSTLYVDTPTSDSSRRERGVSLAGNVTIRVFDDKGDGDTTGRTSEVSTYRVSARNIGEIMEKKRVDLLEDMITHLEVDFENTPDSVLYAPKEAYGIGENKQRRLIGYWGQSRLKKVKALVVNIIEDPKKTSAFSLGLSFSKTGSSTGRSSTDGSITTGTKRSDSTGKGLSATTASTSPDASTTARSTERSSNTGGGSTSMVSSSTHGDDKGTYRRPKKSHHPKSESPVIRLFICATPNDLNQEREQLLKVLYPELHRLCNQSGFILVYTDMRSGLSTEVFDSREALATLSELRRCQRDNGEPFMLCFLSEKYGRVPGPVWYLGGDLTEKLVREYGFIPGFSQEATTIIRGAFDSANPNAFFFLRNPAFIQNPGFAQLSFEKKAMFQDYVLDPEIDKFTDELDGERAFLRQHLKANLWVRFGINQVKEYYCSVEEFGSDPHPVRFSTQDLDVVMRQAQGLIWDRIIAQYRPKSRQRRINIEAVWEQASHLRDSFVKQEASMVSTSESAAMRKVLEYARGSNSQSHPLCSPLIVIGNPGSGKTALLATLVARASELLSDAAVVAYFAGSAKDPAHYATFVSQALHRINDILGRSILFVSSRHSENVVALQQGLKDLAMDGSRKLLLVVDACEILDDEKKQFTFQWIPPTLSPDVRIVVSLRPGAGLQHLRKLLSIKAEMHLPPLTDAEQFFLVSSVLDRYIHPWKHLKTGYALLLHQMHSAVATPSPLWLRIVTFGVATDVFPSIESLQNSDRGIVSQVLNQIEAMHSVAVIKDVCCLVSLASEALLQSELFHMLTDKHSALSWGEFRSIFGDLQPLLQIWDSEDLVCFVSSMVKSVIMDRYGIKSQRNRRGHYSVLIKYFSRQADPNEDGSWQGNHTKALSELPRMLTLGCQWKSLCEILCNVSFIEAKMRHGLDTELVNDYSRALEAMSSDPQVSKVVGPEMVEEVREYLIFVRSNLSSLLKDPSTTLQLAANQPTSSTIAQAAIEALKKIQRPHLAWLNKPEHNLALLRTFYGHSDSVSAVGFSSNGSMLASGSAVGMLRTWNLLSADSIAVTQPHSLRVTSCGFVCGDLQVFSASLDGTVRIFDIWNMKQLHCLSHPREVTCCAVSPDGNRLLSGCWDKVLRLWDAAEGKLVREMRGHELRVSACAFDPDESTNRVVSGSFDRTVVIWNVQTGEKLAMLTGHGAGITAVCWFSPFVGGSRDCIVSVGAELMVRLYTLSDNKCVAFKKFATFNRLCACTCCPVQNRILVGCAEGILVLSGTDLQELAHFKTVTGVLACCSSPGDARFFVSASEDHLLRYWDSSSLHEEVASHLNHASRVCGCTISLSQSLVATCSEDSTVKIWELMTGKLLGTLEGHLDSVSCVAFSPDSSISVICTGSRDGTVRTWNVSTMLMTLVMVGHNKGISAVAYNSDGTTIVSGSEDTTIRLWDSWGGRMLAVVEAHKATVSFLMFSEVVPKIISGCEREEYITLLATGSLHVEEVMKHHTMWIRAVSISPDGSMCVSASSDGDLISWVLETGSMHRLFRGHTAVVNCCDWGHHLDWIASGSDDNTVRIWNGSIDSDPLHSLQLQCIKGHSAPVTSVRFDEYGNMLVACSTDGHLHVWDAESGAIKGSFHVASGWFSSIDYAETIVTGTTEGDVFFLKLEKNRSEDRSRNRRRNVNNNNDDGDEEENDEEGDWEKKRHRVRAKGGILRLLEDVEVMQELKQQLMQPR